MEKTIGLKLLLAGLLLFAPFAARADDDAACPAQKSARVDVRWRSEPVRYDMSLSHDELSAKRIDSKNPYGVHVTTDVGGLMSGKITYTSGIEISTLRYPLSRLTCLWIDKVVVDIVIEPTVYIASEHPQGTCEYAAILEHELQHVAIDRMVVKHYLEKIRVAAGTAVQKVGVVGPKPDDRVEEYKQKMGGYVDSVLQAAADAMYADRTARQQALDSREEYDRVSDKCPD